MAEAVAWFDRSQLGYSRASAVLRFAEGYLRQDDRARAQALLDDVLTVSRELGYRYFEGRAELLLSECMLDDPDAAEAHLTSATRILTAVGARNDLAKALVVQAELRRRAGDLQGSRELLGRALEIFEELGTLDEASRTRAALECPA